MSDTSAPTPPPEPAPRRCENCGAQLLGEHCYACGQPTKGLVRHFSSIFGDFLDSVFNFDTRTLRTLGPLLFKPGHLSREYFYGHRVRYVSPVRLFFFLCIAAFFALQLTVDIDLDGGAGKQTSAIGRAETIEEVTRIRDEAVGELRTAREAIPDTPGARVGMDIAIDAIEGEAERRITWIAARDAAIKRGDAPPAYRGGVVQFDIDDDDDAPTAANDGEARTPASAEDTEAAADKNDDDRPRFRSDGMQFNGKPWHAETNPVRVDWLPERGNAWLNQLIGRAQGNIERIQEQPRLLVEAFIGALPQTLFVLLPLFALMLKVLYLFKRRLYMEHLIVALHSHAFLCAAILLLVGLGVLRDQTSGEGFWYGLLGWFEVAIAIWMPVYLWLMQKRVYRQGWFMTTLKYCVLGLMYVVLLSIGASLSLAVSVVAM
jgi:hypothetical protein